MMEGMRESTILDMTKVKYLTINLKHLELFNSTIGLIDLLLAHKLYLQINDSFLTNLCLSESNLTKGKSIKLF